MTRSTAKKQRELSKMSTGAMDKDDVAQASSTNQHDRDENKENTMQLQDQKLLEVHITKPQKPRTSSDIDLPSKSEKYEKKMSTSKSASSSVLARRKRLELEAAEAKARIQMEIIDKRLEADLAELAEEERYSSQSEGQEDDHARVEVEKWIDRSHHELKATVAPNLGISTGDFVPPPLAPDQQAGDYVSTNGTVQMLASALKDLAAASTANETNAKIVSRLCASKDLPGYGGDPLDWLQFKKAYEESTKVCKFSDQENLWRLRKCLYGAAKSAVTALLISATSPDDVMSTLELQFGNPDIIITRIVYEINKLHPMCQEYHKDIVPFAVKVKNLVAAVSAIGQDEYLKGTSVTSVILGKLPTVLISKWADYSYPLLCSGEKPKLVILSEFLTEEALKISKTSTNLIYNPNEFKRKQSDYNSINKTQMILMQKDCEDKCNYCNKNNHNITDCRKFKRVLRKDRWLFIKRKGLCYKCLVSHHNRETCTAPMCDKDNCGQPHHKLLHYEVKRDRVPCNQNSDLSTTQIPQNETVTNISENSKVLLKTVPVNVHGPNGIVSAVALLDDGSTVTIASDSLIKKLGIKGRKQTLKVCGAWDHSTIECVCEIVDLHVSNKDGMSFKLQARSTNELNLPTQFISLNSESAAINNIKHKLCYGHCKPEILIGQDNYHLLMPLEIIRGKPGEPYITQTPLGWCIHGCTSTKSSTISQHSALFIAQDKDNLDELHEEVRRSFTIEAMGVSGKPRQNANDVRALEQLESTSTLKENRWHVGLPWKDENCTLPESYTTAMNRLKNVERKMKYSDSYAMRYKERIYHLFENDYACEVDDAESTSRTWYLPHFGVDNPNKKKLRLIFDAASKSHKYSLNDFLLSGPDLLVSLYGIMLRFRENRVAVTGDIRDMFLRIKIRTEDQDVLRFLWRDSPDQPVKIYKMTSLIFGANCSPFIAQFIKNKNAQLFTSTYPDAVNAICKQHYVDDYIDSMEDESSAIKITNEIAQIHNNGGFEIRNWNSNNENVLKQLPQDTLCPTSVSFKVGQQDAGERTLGLLWYPKEDVLGYDTSFKRIPENIINGTKRPTKREMLRLITSIFDVYGFLSPFTIKAKIFLQQLWKINLSWDDEIPEDIFIKWLDWLKLLKQINTIRIPRCYHASLRESETDVAVALAPSVPNSVVPTDAPQRAQTTDKKYEPSARALGPTTSLQYKYNNPQLHIFCDSSTLAMAVVAYWRWENHSGQIQIAFVTSKCRVAPLKHMTVPRLELQAAVLAARLAKTIISEQRCMMPTERYFWCDSTTVLHWIKNNTRDYKTFVAHRLGEIDELTQMKEWHYIPSAMNIADIATRDTCEINDLTKEWLYGPDFLYQSQCNWPTGFDLPDISHEVLERVTLVTTAEVLPPVPDPERFSSWLRLLRSTCVMLSFIDKCKRLTGVIDGEMMRRAERLLILYSQRQSFAEDLEHLKQNKQLQKKSKLLTLTPVIDECGILRVGSRIEKARGISTETKYPIILDGRDYITHLLVRYYHVKAAHGYQELVVNELKQKYWIIRLRPTVKHITTKCMFCRIRRARPLPPRMGDLPEARMAHHQRPFSFCGTDLFGPMEVTVGRRREKRYGVIFTCLTVRAIHIEVVTKLTTDAFIMALRRMAARRGWPLRMYSDNGTNLRGADAELRKSIHALDQETLKGYAVNYGTTWTFSPPGSPHWGGAWERLIGCVKRTLKVILKERAPRDEVLNTLLAEVEHVVNSRPLTHVSVEPHTDESLTPNHFLLGTSSNLPTIGTYDDSDIYLRKLWRQSQRLADLFWRRWVREVLPDMRPRTKWCQEQRPLEVGDLVLVVDPDSPRNVWPRGRIESVTAGKDGRIRVVDIKTKCGRLRRSATRVARLITENEC